jgi:hypothetical protein
MLGLSLSADEKVAPLERRQARKGSSLLFDLPVLLNGQ